MQAVERKKKMRLLKINDNTVVDLDKIEWCESWVVDFDDVDGITLGNSWRSWSTEKYTLDEFVKLWESSGVRNVPLEAKSIADMLD